ncbi:MAG: hypothetical protein GX478_06990, partial [Erysipelotrichaceae bacterium]|nr:hypothetical protein [Erysipelotrichaceae bacterium]
ILMIPLTVLIGYQGAIIASLIGGTYLLIANVYGLQKQFHIEGRRMMIHLAKIIMALAVMTMACYALKFIGLNGAVGTSKWIALCKFAANMILSLLIYLGVSQLLHIPEDLFHRRFSSMIKAKIKHQV